MTEELATASVMEADAPVLVLEGEDGTVASFTVSEAQAMGLEDAARELRVLGSGGDPL